MTITYTSEVGTCSGFGVFWKLLFRWRGSIYKLIWQDLALYIVLYFSLSILYRFLLDEAGKKTFEQISVHCAQFADLIPVAFVLGFYVSIILTRWWEQYNMLPWPDSCCLFISTTMHGHDDRGRLLRRTIARYLNLALVQTLRLSSVQVKKRFPTLDHLVEVGILTENEKKIWINLDEKCIQHPKYWMPLVWAGAIVTRAKKEGRITDEFAGKTIIDEINKFRGGCGGLLNYDWISVPLVYTQVVTLAVFTFFMSSLMGRQFLDASKNIPGHEVDLVVPVFSFLQFFFYMGWLKVAEAFINPFGENDDDFEINWLIDRNLQVSYLIVDEMHQEHPELVKDQFWDEGIPEELPYTAASEQFRTEPWVGSTADVEISPAGAEFVTMEPIMEDDDQPLFEVTIDDVKPTIPVNIKNGKIVSQDVSRNGSMSTLPIGSIGPRRESVISMLSRILHTRTSRQDLGSIVSVRSKESAFSGRTRRKYKRKKYRKPSIIRSSSKASNLSQGNITPNVLSRVATKENEIFKMSSMSSLNSTQMDPSEFPTRRSSDEKALLKVKELLKKDLQSYHRGTGIGSFEPRFRVGSDSSHRNGNNDKQKKAKFKSEAKILKKKLEEVQSAHVEIMKELEDEIMSSDDELNETTNDLVNSLTKQTDALKKALQHRRQLEARDNPEEYGSPNLAVSPFHENGIFSDQVTSQQSLLSIPENTCLQEQTITNPTFHCSITETEPPHPIKSPSRASASATLTNTPVQKVGLQEGASIQPLVPLSTAGSTRSQNISSQSLDTMFALDDYDDGEACVDVPPTSVASSVTTNSPIEEVDSEFANGKEETDDYYDGAFDPSSLGTIQELPELGYVSDGSESDFNLQKHKKKLLVKKKCEDGSDESLVTLTEGVETVDFARKNLQE